MQHWKPAKAVQDYKKNYFGEIENLGLTDAIFTPLQKSMIYAWTPPNICIGDFWNLIGNKQVIVFSVLLNSAKWAVQIISI